MNDILIVLIGLFSLWLFLKYRTKKHRENLVSVFEKSHAKFAVNRKSQAAFQKATKEWERKHPIKALKRRIKRLFW
jgi:hypothetical protein